MTSSALTPDAFRRRAEVLAWQEKSPPDGPGEAGGPDALAQTLYELRVHQIELEMQNEDLRQFRLDLDASRDRYFDFYDMAPVGYCTVNDKGTVIEANLTTATLLGVPRDMLIKQTFSQFIEPADQDIFYRMRKRLIQNQAVQTCELRLRKNESEPFWVSLMASAVPNADQGAVMRIVLNQIDERKRISDALNASEARLRLMFDRATDGIVMLSGDGKLLAVNASFAQMHGYTQAEMTSLHLRDLDTPEAVQELPGLLKRVLAGETLNFEVTHFHKNGHIITLEVSSSLIVANGERLIQAFHRDITERKRNEAQVKHAEEVLRTAVEASEDAFVIYDAEDRLVFCNEGYRQLYASVAPLLVPGVSFEALVRAGAASGQYPAAIGRVEEWVAERLALHRSGSGILIQTLDSGRTLRIVERKTSDGHIVGFRADVTDLYEAKQAAEIARQKLEELSHHLERTARYDSLTKLPNRASLGENLAQALIQTRRRGQHLAVVFIDLDGFKAVNDTHGHEAGDHLLITLAERMKGALRDGDVLARLGGDEFVAVLLDLADVDASAPMLNRLLAAAARPVQFGQARLQVSASLGVTFYPQTQDPKQESEPDQLLRQADQAMYQAKQSGKNRFHVFDAEQDRNVRARHEGMQSIERALNEGELVLEYQPKVNLRTGTVIGVEALIRWRHPQKGMVPPADFLPMIEDHPLAVKLGQWVIESALSQMELWRGVGLDLTVSVNIGTRHLMQAGFADQLREALAAHPGLLPSCLELELLEANAVNDLDRVSKVIQECRAIGVECALDDFGSGHSSLTGLKKLPVKYLKIEQNFIRDMLDSSDSLLILIGVLRLASAFDLKVIAEGVETAQHGSMLLELGCELAQGYGIARPMPADELPGWIKRWKPDPIWSDVVVAPS